MVRGVIPASAAICFLLSGDAIILPLFPALILAFKAIFYNGFRRFFEKVSLNCGIRRQ